MKAEANGSKIKLSVEKESENLLANKNNSDGLTRRIDNGAQVIQNDDHEIELDFIDADTIDLRFDDGGRDEIDTRQLRLLASPVPSEGVDMNAYSNRKTYAQGMMDLALFTANANQLRTVWESKHIHAYFHLNIILLFFSISLQILVACGLMYIILITQYEIKDEKKYEEQMRKANLINNFTFFGVFIITVVNVFIAVFGVTSS